jgi:hypothetical protein
LALKREGYKITDVYFYDHAYVDDDTERVYGLEFGDQGLFVADGTLEEFCRTLGGIVKDGAFHFRGCNVGNEVNYDLLENLAIWTGGMVTGPVTGILPPGGKVVERTFRDPSTGKVIDIPDYISPSGYSVAYPCGYIYTPWDRDWPCIPWCPRGPY